MEAGKLRKRCTFQAETDTADGQGGNTRTWKTVATVWGAYEPQLGREAIAQGRLQGTSMGTLWVRYSDLIATQVKLSSRVVVDGQVHQIRSIIQPDQNRRMLQMVVERGVAPHG